MSPRQMLRLLPFATLTALLMLTESAFAQGDVLRIRRLEGELVRAPQYQVRGGTATQRQRQWLQVTTQYQTAPEWIDEMTFTYYIVLRNSRPEEGQSEFNMFRGEITYVNIAETREGRSAVFLHPSTVERYGELFRVAVVITSQGRTIGMESNPSGDGRWWEQLTPRAGFVLNRMQTPFAMVNFDDYEAIKPPER